MTILYFLRKKRNILFVCVLILLLLPISVSNCMPLQEGGFIQMACDALENNNEELSRRIVNIMDKVNDFAPLRQFIEYVEQNPIHNSDRTVVINNMCLLLLLLFFLCFFYNKYRNQFVFIYIKYYKWLQILINLIIIIIIYYHHNNTECMMPKIEVFDPNDKEIEVFPKSSIEIKEISFAYDFYNQGVLESMIKRSPHAKYCRDEFLYNNICILESTNNELIASYCNHNLFEYFYLLYYAPLILPKDVAAFLIQKDVYQGQWLYNSDLYNNIINFYKFTIIPKIDDKQQLENIIHYITALELYKKLHSQGNLHKFEEILNSNYDPLYKETFEKIVGITIEKSEKVAVSISDSKSFPINVPLTDDYNSSTEIEKEKTPFITEEVIYLLLEKKGVPQQQLVEDESEWKKALDLKLLSVGSNVLLDPSSHLTSFCEKLLPRMEGLEIIEKDIPRIKKLILTMLLLDDREFNWSYRSEADATNPNHYSLRMREICKSLVLNNCESDDKKCIAFGIIMAHVGTCMDLINCSKLGKFDPYLYLNSEIYDKMLENFIGD